MDWKRIGRLLVCLVLVVCLIGNIVSPVKATEGATWATVSIPADVGVSSIMNGLGVLPGESPDAYDGIVERCVDYLTEQGRVVSGKIDAWKREQVEGTPWAYGIDVSIIDVIRAWIFRENIVTAPPKVSGTEAEHYLSIAQGWKYYFIATELDGGLAIGYNNAPFETGVDSDGIKYVTNRTQSYSCAMESWNWQVVNSRKISVLSVTVYTTGVNDGYDSTYDVTLGAVYSPDISLAEAYPIWHGNSIAVPPIVGGGSETDDDVIVYPIAPGDTLADTQSKTQEDVWAGSSTFTDSGTDSEAGSGTTGGTLADVISAIKAIPAAFAEWFADVISWGKSIWEAVVSIPQAIADVLTAIFVPAEDYISVKVDALRAKFPFIDSVIATGEFIRDSVSGASGPPAIYVDLGLAASGNYGSRKVLLADFAWYAKYKPTVDTLLSAALWAFFGWRVFLKLPGIISGESGYIGEVAAHKEKMDKIRSGPPGKR